MHAETSLEFSYLFDRPELVPLVIRWWHSVWSDRMGSDFASLEQQLADSLSKTNFPIHVIASLDQQPVATAALKWQEMPEQFPELHYWLGSVFVEEGWRGRQLGSRITSHIIELAKERQLPHLYLQTQDPSGGLYAELGWQAKEEFLAHGERTLLMYLPLAEETGE